MKNDLAFRFIGKLANDVTRNPANISSGNAVFACIDAGIALIDMTSSIITYSSECKRTDMLQHQIFESKVLLDIMVDEHLNAANTEIEHENKRLVESLNKLKLELSNEYESIRLHVENEKMHLFQDIEFERKRNQIIDNIRLMIKDILTISTEALEKLNSNPVKNKIHIAILDEQIRVSTVQYTKMIKLVS